MADFLILKREPGAVPGPKGWSVVGLAVSKTADAAGATEALKENYTGPGRYGVVRADNARTTNVTEDPKMADDPAPAWQ